MDSLYKGIQTFTHLLDISYHIVIGRKGKSRIIDIEFDKKDCFHLLGLQYLKDLPQLNRSRDKIFNDIAMERITENTLKKSVFYPKIQERIEYLSALETFFDDNQTIFKYNYTWNAFSAIRAEFLLENEYLNRTIYVFLDKQKDHIDTFFCRSFFPKNTLDYGKNQTRWTLLYKEKKKKSLETTEILYNHLKPPQNIEY